MQKEQRGNFSLRMVKSLKGNTKYNFYHSKISFSLNSNLAIFVARNYFRDVA